MPPPFLRELLLVLAFGLLAGLICKRLRIPSLVGYLIAGSILGHGALGWVSRHTHEIEYLAEAGVFLLLFSIGLEFSFDELARLRRHILLGGAAQMLACAVPAGIALYLLDFPPTAAVLLGAAVSFSSTVLVFKSLSEAGHADTPHGRRAIGVLLFQDAALVPLLLLTSVLVGDPPTATDYLWLVAASAFFLLAILVLRYLLTVWMVPFLSSHRSLELTVLFSLVVLGAVTMFASTLGLPPAVGAFAAGLCLGGNRFSGQFDALLLPFRETFAAIFFVSLGLLMNLTQVAQEPHIVLGGILALLVLKTLAASLALWLTSLPPRQSLGMGIGLAHVGEFAFVLLLEAHHNELIRYETSERFIAIGVGSLILSPLLMQYGLRFARLRSAAEQQDAELETLRQEGHAPGRAMVIGLGPVGRSVASQLETMGYELTLVDRSPINVHALAQLGAHTLAGDATEGTLLDAAETPTFELVVVCVPDDEVSLRVVQQIRQRNTTARILVRCRYASSVGKLRRAGADMAVSEEATASLEMLARISKMERQ
ncbi:cation:proton antiporter [Aeoliella sp. ICT_H6.2]|uniref:Cation:proton antiporter n=1 Tax=Aeoliella straminimaris TaxID=2954799 RepID=A0A9X2FF31_9BACT|nr:cation:proton antiporter [Aeoliella straminimaris]